MRVAILFSVFTFFIYLGCDNSQKAVENKNDISAVRQLEGEQLVHRGQYLTTVAGCNDCHSPKKFNAHGFTFDSGRLLSGHPADSPLPPIEVNATQPGGWMLMGPDLTSFVGPWGISYAANLTPDSAAGIGAWTEDNFIQALRKGKHLGMDNGRPVLPPMPWEIIGKMTDEDLKSIYAYLRTLPPIANKVPAPLPPNEVVVVKPNPFKSKKEAVASK